MRSMLYTAVAGMMMTGVVWADTVDVQPAQTIGHEGGRAIDPGRDGNDYTGFRFDFADGVRVLSSDKMVSDGAVVLDFETEHGWPDALVSLPPRGNVLSSPSRDPFRPRDATPLEDVTVGSHRVRIEPAALDPKAETLTLNGMVTTLPKEETGVYLVQDDAAGDAGGVTLSGVQGVIAAPASHGDRQTGMLITFDRPVRAAGVGAFNRSTAYGGDNNLELAAFATDGQLLGRYRLPGGKTVDDGGKGTPMYVGLETSADQPIKHLYVGHLHASSRNLVFDDLAFIPAP